MGEINIGVQDAYQAGLDVSKVSVTQAKTESPAVKAVAKEVISNSKEVSKAVHARVSEVNAALREMDRDFGLRIDETLNRPVITLVKESTGEVLQQLPSEDFLNAARNIQQLSGILLKLKS